MASKPTGNPRGRPKGAKNKRTAQLEAKVAEQAAKIAKVMPDAFDGDAHAFLMTVYKDPKMPIGIRLDAAKAAAPFEKPKLANIEHSGSVGDGKDATELSDAELAEIADHARRSGSGAAPPAPGKGEPPQLH